MIQHGKNMGWHLLLPERDAHVARETSGEVELGRDQVQENNDFLVRGVGNLEQLLEDADLLLAVGVLLTTGVDNLLELLEQVVLGELDGLSSSTDGGEAIILLIGRSLLRVRGDNLLGLLALGLDLDNLLLDVVVLGILLVLLNLLLVQAVVLLDLLLHRVQSLGIGGVHLLGSGLFLVQSGLNGLLQVSNSLDIELRDTVLGNDADSLLETLVGAIEFYYW